MRKIYFLLVISILSVLVIGCNSENSSENTEEGNSSNINSDFPEEDITTVVPYSTGGAGDISIRIMADLESEYLKGNSMVVDNIDGAGGIKGQTEVATAEPDGYTLLELTTSAVNNPMIEDTEFDIDSFAPLAMFSFEPELRVVPKSSDIDSIEDFLDYAKSNEISVNTSGFGTSHHIGALVLENEADVKFKYVHADSGGDKIHQLMGDHAEAGFLTYGSASEALEEEEIKPIGVMSDERIEQLPETETFEENDLDIEYGPFRAMAAPKDTPEDVLNQLYDMFDGIINDEDFKNKMEDSGYEVEYGDKEELQKQMDTQTEFMEDVLPMLEEE